MPNDIACADLVRRIDKLSVLLLGYKAVCVPASGTTTWTLIEDALLSVYEVADSESETVAAWLNRTREHRAAVCEIEGD